MARSGDFGFLTFLLIAGGVAVLSISRAAARVQDPVTETQNYLVDCASKLTDRCGDDIFGNIFSTQHRILTHECCKKLVSMGKECHNAMVTFVLSNPASRRNASITKPRSKQVWKKCVLLAKEAPSEE